MWLTFANPLRRLPHEYPAPVQLRAFSLGPCRRLFHWVAGSDGAGEALEGRTRAGYRAGERRIVPEEFTNCGRNRLFYGKRWGDRPGLWRTNGTPGGTMPVADILPGPLTAFPGPNSFGSLNELLVFRAYEDNAGAELWRSEGLAANTVQILDLNPGASGSNPFGLVEIDGALMFDAEVPATGAELYRTDGTAAGTSLVMDIWPGASGSSPASFQRAGNAVFFSAERPAEGRELWRTLGTFLTTTLVRDIQPGANSSNITSMTPWAIGCFFPPPMERRAPKSG